MSRPRLPYQQERIDLERARRRALRTHPKPCDCSFCITHERTEELVRAALARNLGAGEEVPF